MTHILLADALRVWRDIVLPSWLSLATAPLVLVGYVLLGRKRREGWLLVMAAQAGLLAIGWVHHEWGLAAVLVLIWQAAANWRRWKPAAPQPARAA